MTTKAQSIIEYVFIAMLVILGVIVMGPYVIRSVGAHFKLWDEVTQDALNDRQVPINIGITGECHCDSPVAGACKGTGWTIQCAPDERLYASPCTPPTCGFGTSAYKERCVSDPAFCCGQYNSCSSTQGNSITGCCGDAGPRPNGSSPDSQGLLSANSSAAANDSQSVCYAGEEIMHNQCGSNPPGGIAPVKCKVNPQCKPSCIGTLDPNATKCTGAWDGLTRDWPVILVGSQNVASCPDYNANPNAPKCIAQCKGCTCPNIPLGCNTPSGNGVTVRTGSTSDTNSQEVCCDKGELLAGYCLSTSSPKPRGGVTYRDSRCVRAFEGDKDDDYDSDYVYYKLFCVPCPCTGQQCNTPGGIGSFSSDTYYGLTDTVSTTCTDGSKPQAEALCGCSGSTSSPPPVVSLPVPGTVDAHSWNKPGVTADSICQAFGYASGYFDGGDRWRSPEDNGYYYLDSAGPYEFTFNGRTVKYNICTNCGDRWQVLYCQPPGLQPTPDGKCVGACGNGKCDQGKDCFNCPQDCGQPNTGFIVGAWDLGVDGFECSDSAAKYPCQTAGIPFIDYRIYAHPGLNQEDCGGAPAACGCFHSGGGHSVLYPTGGGSRDAGNGETLTQEVFCTTQYPFCTCLNPPANATMCSPMPHQDGVLTNMQATLVTACDGITSCQYTCKAGYRLSQDSKTCVK